jgi:hypothetical protein
MIDFTLGTASITQTSETRGQVLQNHIEQGEQTRGQVLPFAYLRTKCGLNTAKNGHSGLSAASAEGRRKRALVSLRQWQLANDV